MDQAVHSVPQKEASLVDGSINAYLTHLAVEGHVSASPQNQTLSAILFLYNKVLEEDIGRVGEVVRAHKPRRRLWVFSTPRSASRKATGFEVPSTPTLGGRFESLRSAGRDRDGRS